MDESQHIMNNESQHLKGLCSLALKFHLASRKYCHTNYIANYRISEKPSNATRLIIKINFNENHFSSTFLKPLVGLCITLSLQG